MQISFHARSLQEIENKKSVIEQKLQGFGRSNADQAPQILQVSGIDYTTAQEYEQAIVQLSVDINVLFRSHITMY